MRDASMRETLRAWWQALTGSRVPPDPRVIEFRRAVAAATTGALDRALLAALAERPAALGLADEDVELEIEMLHGAADLLYLQDEVRAQGLPVIAHQHKALGAERCHFLASASLVGADGDRSGRLFMTERRIVFLAAPLVALPWSGVTTVADEGRDLLVAGPARPGGLRFRCNSISDARRGGWLSDRLRRNGSRP